MAAIRIQNVTKQFGGQVVLDDVSLELHPGQTVGLIGPNGAGKTTLFRLITGDLAPDMGTVTRAKGLVVGYLPQEPAIGLENTLHDEVLSVFADVLARERRMQRLSEQMGAARGAALESLMSQYDRVQAEFEASGGYTYEQQLSEILGGLGFTQADRDLPMAALSGGQKCRAALARLLLRDSSYLLLDEPTNHLDIDAVRWLEKFLAGHHGGAVIVSHDRYLLDRLADSIVELEGAKVTSFPGNYSNYVHVRELRKLTQERRYKRDRSTIEKERDFIARHKAGQRTKEAEGRRRRLERRLKQGEFVLERPTAQREMKLAFDAEVREGRVEVEVTEVGKRYGEKQLFSGLAMEVMTGHRWGITGPNGTGKTTLLRIMLGQVEPDEGTVRVDGMATVGYFAQEASELDDSSTVLQHILELRPQLGAAGARSLLARYRFLGDDVFKVAGSLSGGEQSRLRLCKLILSSPSVLVLDEPTNHLDIPSREALEDALEAFAGTIVAVSHDRYFLDRVVERVLVLRPEGHRQFLGNYSDYIRIVEEEAKAAEPRRGAAKRGALRRETGSGADKPSRKQSRFERAAMVELEEFIITCEARVAEFEAKFTDPELYRDGARVAKLRAEFAALKRELAEAEEVWGRRADLQ